MKKFQKVIDNSYRPPYAVKKFSAPAYAPAPAYPNPSKKFVAPSDNLYRTPYTVKKFTSPAYANPTVCPSMDSAEITVLPIAPKFIVNTSIKPEVIEKVVPRLTYVSPVPVRTYVSPVTYAPVRTYVAPAPVTYVPAPVPAPALTQRQKKIQEFMKNNFS